MPPARVWNDEHQVGASASPTSSSRTEEITVKANAPDWWGEIAPTPTGLTEDRYVSAVEVREVNDVELLRAAAARPSAAATSSTT